MSAFKLSSFLVDSEILKKLCMYICCGLPGLDALLLFTRVSWAPLQSFCPQVSAEAVSHSLECSSPLLVSMWFLLMLQSQIGSCFLGCSGHLHHLLHLQGTLWCRRRHCNADHSCNFSEMCESVISATGLWAPQGQEIRHFCLFLHVEGPYSWLVLGNS